MRWHGVIALVVAACGGHAPSPAPVVGNQAEAQPVAAEGVQYVGDPHARVVVDYWFDYQCPPCVESSPIIDAMERKYGDRIVVYYHNMPLSAHPDGKRAAIAAEAARRQGKYIEMHRALMASSVGPAFTLDAIRRTAGSLGLDLARSHADLGDASAEAAIDAEIAAAEAVPIDFVPALRINHAPFQGNLTAADLSAALDAAFAGP